MIKIHIPADAKNLGKCNETGFRDPHGAYELRQVKYQVAIVTPGLDWGWVLPSRQCTCGSGYDVFACNEGSQECG